MQNSITFTKEQYLNLVKAIQIADSVYGIMSDMVDEKYKKEAAEIDELTNIVLSHAEKFGVAYMSEKYMGKWVLTNEYAEDYFDDLMLYEDFVMWDNLANNLAKRDMGRIYTQKQLEEMDQMKYIELESNIEEKYHEEFKKNGLNGIEIKIGK